MLLRLGVVVTQKVEHAMGQQQPKLGGQVVASNLFMGGTAASVGNVVSNDGGSLFVTNALGTGSLVVGVAFAKAYAAALECPIIGVNHIEAHLHSASLEHGDSPWPAVALIVSGGHTELVEVKGLGQYRWLGATLDDAAGEAYDKVAKRMGLGFPGGPVIDKLAATGRADAFGFTRPMAVLPYFLPDAGPEPAADHGTSPHGRPYFLFVGRLAFNKGIDILSEALELLGWLRLFAWSSAQALTTNAVATMVQSVSFTATPFQNG